MSDLQLPPFWKFQTHPTVLLWVNFTYSERHNERQHQTLGSEQILVSGQKTRPTAISRVLSVQSMYSQTDIFDVLNILDNLDNLDIVDIEDIEDIADILDILDILDSQLTHGSTKNGLKQLRNHY